MEDAENDWRKTFQGEFNDSFGLSYADEFDTKTHAEALRCVSSNKVEAAEFQAGQPFDTAFPQFIQEDAPDCVTA
jgi:hypothetical protein